MIQLLLVLLRKTTYVDAAYCYRPSSLVCRSVCRSDTLMSSAKTAEAIEMPLALRTSVGPVPTIRYRRALRAEYCIVGIPHNTAI